MKRILTAVFLSLLSTLASAGSVDLTWLASATTGQNAPTGYNAYWGTTRGGPYPSKKNAGLVLNTNVPNLTAGNTYCFVVTAYNAAGESGFSNEGCATIPFPPANSAPLAPAAAPSVTANP